MFKLRIYDKFGNLDHEEYFDTLKELKKGIMNYSDMSYIVKIRQHGE